MRIKQKAAGSGDNEERNLEFRIVISPVFSTDNGLLTRRGGTTAPEAFFSDLRERAKAFQAHFSCQA
jgi:hypothetical protein